MSFLILLAGIVSKRIEAHIPTYGVGTLSRLIFKEDKILLTFDLSYDGFWAQGEMIRADTDKDSKVGDDEAGAYLRRQWTDKVAPRLHAKLDGNDVALRKVAERHEGLVGEIYGVPFSLYFEIEIDAPRRFEPGSDHHFELEDEVVKDETPAKPLFYVPYVGHGQARGARFNPQFLEPEPALLDIDSYRLEGRKLRVKFSFDEAPGTPPKAAADPSPSQPEPPRAPPAAPEALKGKIDRRNDAPAGPGGMESALESYDDLTWLAMAGLVLLALFYGAGHALTPGHGKTMVAAYLIGTRGRIRDGVLLGITTTITHMGSVFLFGVVIFLIVNASARYSEGALRNMVVVATRMVSGGLLLLLGLAIFFRRSGILGHGHAHGHDHHHHGHHHNHHHDHHHHHGHDHHHPHPVDHHQDHGHQDHGHDHHPSELSHPEHQQAPEPGEDRGLGLLEGGKPRMRDLIALGFSGGIVPCPAGLAAILTGIQYPRKLLFALFLLVFFSIGLGAVLVAIGVFLITGKALAAGKSAEGAFFQEITFLRRRFSPSFLGWLDRVGVEAIRVLPVFSGLFIAGLGAFFCVSTYRVGKTEIAAMLRLVADWL